MLYSSDSLLASFIPCPKLMTSLFCSLTTEIPSPHCNSFAASTSPFPSFLSVSSSLLIIAPQLMAAFTLQRPVRAAACLRSHLHASHSPSPTWESCLPASAGLSAVQSRPLLCHRKLTNRWRATFPPVKCKCYKVHYHAGRVSLQIRKTDLFCFSHICLYIHLHACMHSCIYSSTFDFWTRNTHPGSWASEHILKLSRASHG